MGEHLSAVDSVPFLVAVNDGVTFDASAIAGHDLLLVPAQVLRLGQEETIDGL